MSEPELIPFGKYRGMPVDAILDDRQYAEWLIAQGWFREKYQNLYITIQNGGAQSDMTPEHNRMQARFLDDDYVKKFVGFLFERSSKTNAQSFEIDDMEFEKLGWDVAFIVKWVNENSIRDRRGFLIELKPQISDDFPAIIRQVKSRGDFRNCTRLVLCDTFDPHAAVPFESVKKMFHSSGILLLLSSEFE